jgi:hypothetical protein
LISSGELWTINLITTQNFREGTTMTKALATILANCPAHDGSAIWNDAIVEAAKLPMQRGQREAPVERLARLRETLKGELVAFHDHLVVTPHDGGKEAGAGKKFWNIQIPLTLFPKRDRGFTRTECIVEFRTDSEKEGGFRLVELFPKERSRVLAQGLIGGKLELKTQVGMKVPVPLPVGTSSAEAKVKVYGEGGAEFEYKAERQCVIAEIIGGRGARWRLDDLQDASKVGAESHQLGVIMEVQDGTPPIHAAGCLNAYSEEKWLTQPVSDVVSKLAHNLVTFFKKGAPAEAYAEWQNILPTQQTI